MACVSSRVAFSYKAKESEKKDIHFIVPNACKRPFWGPKNAPFPGGNDNLTNGTCFTRGISWCSGGPGGGVVVFPWLGGGGGSFVVLPRGSEGAALPVSTMTPAAWFSRPLPRLC